MKRKPRKRSNEPLVTLGQGKYARHIRPSDLERTPVRDEGGLVGVLVLIVLYFIAGVLIGAWLW